MPPEEGISRYPFTNSQHRSTRSTCSFSALLLRGGRPIATATQRPPRIVLRMFHPAGGENSGASLGGSVMRNGIKPILAPQFCGFWLGWGRPEYRNSGVRTTQSVYDTGSNDLGGSLPLSATVENSRDGDRCTNAGNGTRLLPCSAAFWAGHEILRTAPDHGATLHPCPRR